VTRPGGFVYLSVPDAGHPAVPADIWDWTDIWPPEHLQFFTLKNLRVLLQIIAYVHNTLRDDQH
jgi:hypothetical protein